MDNRRLKDEETTRRGRHGGTINRLVREATQLTGVGQTFSMKRSVTRVNSQDMFKASV